MLQARKLILNDPRYLDLTQTQYALGLEWLKGVSLVEEDSTGLRLAHKVKGLPEAELRQIFFEASLESAMPAWIIDADLMIRDAEDLPQDAASIAEVLQLPDSVVLSAIRHVHGRIDLAERSRIGSAGELALIALLERQWPGSTTHVAATDDGFGYDIVFHAPSHQWHLEVKSTTRRGRVVIYLSRHEYEVGLRDPQWRLIVVGLDQKLNAKAVATVRFAELVSRAPRDTSDASRWQSASHQLAPQDLITGLAFVEPTWLPPGLLDSYWD